MTVTDVTINPHRNRTSDGVFIMAGLRVLDYDRRVGTVVSDDDTDSYRCCQSRNHQRANDLTEDLTGCDAACGHDHWFMVRRDDGSTKSFNGSRLESRP